MNATRNRKGWIRSRRGALAGVSCVLLGLAARVAPRSPGTPFRLGVPARQLAWVLSAALFGAAAVLLAFGRGREAGARLRRPVRRSLCRFTSVAACVRPSWTRTASHRPAVPTLSGSWPWRPAAEVAGVAKHGVGRRQVFVFVETRVPRASAASPGYSLAA
jgi:hypothetical protein